MLKRNAARPSSPKRNSRSIIIKIIASLGLFAPLLVWGTSAAWQAEGGVDGIDITAGSLDLQLRTDVEGLGAKGLGVGHQAASIAAADMKPGETHAYAFSLHNGGDVAFTYTGSISKGQAWSMNGSPLAVRLHAGKPSGQIGAQRCTGESVGPRSDLSESVSILDDQQVLDPGASRELCLEVSLDKGSRASQSVQAGSFILHFEAKQVPR